MVIKILTFAKDEFKRFYLDKILAKKKNLIMVTNVL